MADLAASLQTAKQAGYTDAQIVDHLASDPSMGAQVASARKYGYSDGEIVSHLAASPAPPPAKPKPPTAQDRAASDAKRFVGNSRPDQVSSFNQGATLGFADEANALYGAAHTGVTNFLAHATGGKDNGYSMKDAYGAIMDEEHARNSAFADAHPAQNAALTIAGAVATPGAGAAARYVGSAPNALMTAARSAGVGAAYGAIAGAGAGEGQGRLTGAAEGGAIGGVFGAAAPVAARVGQAIAKRVGAGASEAASRVAQGVGMQPREPNAQQVAKAGGRAVNYVSDLAKNAEPGALSANAVEAAGKPVTAAEALGRTGVTQLAAIARRSGKTGDALESTLRQRAQAMPERVLSDLHDLTGVSPEAVAGDFASHAQKLREAAAPLYNEAYAVGAVDSPKLRALAARPAVKDAMNRAANIASEEGRNPAELGFVTTTQRAPGGGSVDVVSAVQNPTAQTWDYVKRGLDDVIEGSRNPVTRRLDLDEKGRAQLGTLNALRSELTTLNPAYKAALEAGGEPLRLEEAFRDAPKLISPSVSERVFTQRFGALSPAQQEAFKGGFLNSVYEGARNGRLKLRDMQQPAFATKARAVLGDEAANTFLQRVEQEAQLAKTGGRMNPGSGSPTMELEAADKENAAALSDMRGAAGKLAQGKPVQAAIQAIGSPIAGAYRGMQAPIDQATRDEVGRLLQLSPRELDQVLEAAKNAPRKAAPTGGRAVPAIANASGQTAGRK